MPVISTNTAANSALRFLSINNTSTQSSIGKLSSGSRIVKASDDAASLAISTNLNSEIVTLKQSAVNAAHGQAVAQVVDGSLARISDILSRMKALATQSLSGSMDSTSQGYIQEEFSALQSQITAIAEQTEFNGQELGAVGNLTFMVGRAGDEAITVSTTNVSATGLAVNSGAISVGAATAADDAITAIDTAIGTVNTQRAKMGAYMSRFQFVSQNLDTQVENLEAAKSALLDTDVAAEMTKFTSAQVLMQANVAMLAQANQLPSGLLRLLS